MAFMNSVNVLNYALGSVPNALRQANFASVGLQFFDNTTSVNRQVSPMSDLSLAFPKRKGLSLI